jgi:hypothetical protein
MPTPFSESIISEHVPDLNGSEDSAHIIHEKEKGSWNFSVSWIHPFILNDLKEFLKTRTLKKSSRSSILKGFILLPFLNHGFIGFFMGWMWSFQS